MWILILTCAATISLLLGPSVEVQTDSPNQEAKRTSSIRHANQNTASSSLAQANPEPASSPSISPATLGQNAASPAPSSSTTAESKELFSQLTLFLFGSGIAFFIALLAWSDQIRGIDQDIKELETKFLERTGIEKQTFLRIVKPKSPDDRGEALLEVVSGGRIKNKDAAEVLQIFTKWHKPWSWIETLAAAKYYVTIGLTFLLFLMGFASLFTNPAMQFVILSKNCSVEKLILIPPATLVLLLLIIIICIAEREHALRSLLKSVSDMV